jgi:hypothetical protein
MLNLGAAPAFSPLRPVLPAVYAVSPVAPKPSPAVTRKPFNLLGGGTLRTQAVPKPMVGAQAGEARFASETRVNRMTAVSIACALVKSMAMRGLNQPVSYCI